MSARLTSNDLRRAAQIAKKSIPCAGSMREALVGEDGPQTAHCIMGCVYQAVAERRKQSFNLIRKNLGSEDVVANQLGLATKTLKNDDDVNLVDQNDYSNVTINSNDLRGVYSPEEFKQFLRENRNEIKKARKWQVDTLNKLAKELDKNSNGVVTVGE